MVELELRNKLSEHKSKVVLRGNLIFTQSDEGDDPQEIAEKLNNEVKIKLLNKLRETDPNVVGRPAIQAFYGH